MQHSQMNCEFLQFYRHINWITEWKFMLLENYHNYEINEVVSRYIYLFIEPKYSAEQRNCYTCQKFGGFQRKDTFKSSILNWKFAEMIFEKSGNLLKCTLYICFDLSDSSNQSLEAFKAALYQKLCWEYFSLKWKTPHKAKSQNIQ